MTPTRIAIIGCAGRMGRALLRLAAADTNWRVVAAVSIADDPNLGRDAGEVAGLESTGVSIGERLEGSADAAVEFTSPAGAALWARQCAERGVALVSGTTGLDPNQKAALADAARTIPLLWSANMSIGVNVLLNLARQAAAALDDWECEIVEAHHNRKADAPSGTARALLEAVCSSRGVSSENVVRHGREGVIGPRSSAEVGVHAIRLGGIVGDHDVMFGVPGETLTLRHHAESRDIFAAGALRAARWLRGKSPGMYSMQDVLR